MFAIRSKRAVRTSRNADEDTAKCVPENHAQYIYIHI